MKWGAEDQIMPSFVKSYILSYLLRKVGRDRIPIGSQAAEENDDLYIHIYSMDFTQEPSFVISSLKNNILECERRDEKDQKNGEKIEQCEFK